MKSFEEMFQELKNVKFHFSETQTDWVNPGKDDGTILSIKLVFESPDEHISMWINVIDNVEAEITPDWADGDIYAFGFVDEEKDDYVLIYGPE